MWLVHQFNIRMFFKGSNFETVLLKTKCKKKIQYIRNRKTGEVKHNENSI